ncbi:hypothetical protein [Xylella fastidiosa]|uniref:hypothetical protein n=1 Tax=Xylella fastidiosa TaxID=2371 RepID=UPI001314C79E|nr:hypothetical protein [Xylella fastidiosa]WGZ34708.1 hypothetical protein O4445_02020 [Xylella fastidiosa subsp. pauca]WGZ36987.1 hypothetical protein O4443_02015 [Xylella fastidiosa subsp. pauca]
MNNTTACLRALDAFYLTAITSEKRKPSRSKSNQSSTKQRHAYRRMHDEKAARF